MNGVMNFLSSLSSSGPSFPDPSKAVALYSFLDADLSQTTEQGACGRLAHAIWNAQSIDSIQRLIGRCSDLNKKFTEAELTLFTLAAITDHYSAMEALKKAGANLDAQDFQGYTALHHMALKGNIKGVSQLLSWGANPNLRYLQGGTYADLLRFNAPFRKNDGFQLDPSLFSAHRINPETFDPSCAPNVRLVDEVVAKPEALLEAWTKKAKIVKKDQEDPALAAHHDYVLARYAEFKKNPTKLTVVPIVTNDAGQPLGIESRFCGLRAVEPIKQGQVIAEYTGEFVATSEKDNRDPIYLYIAYPAIDAGPFRSAAAMANDGFPNAYMEGISLNERFESGLDGLPARKLLMALENIAPGEEITINYGASHPVKQQHTELRPEAIRAFFKKHTWKHILEARDVFRSPNSSQQRRLGAINSLKTYDYFSHTPSTFKWLAKEGLFTRADLALIREANAKEPLFDNNPIGDTAVKVAARELDQRDL